MLLEAALFSEAASL